VSEDADVDRIRHSKHRTPYELSGTAANIERTVVDGALHSYPSLGGVDNFRFTSRTHSPNNGNRDQITDFDKGGTADRIDVSALFGPKMQYIHAAAFTKLGQVRINDVAGPDVLVEANVVGSLAADFSVRLKATTLASMNAGDFIL
jgi:hypothetical protein